jgi:hypothetical protein
MEDIVHTATENGTIKDYTMDVLIGCRRILEGEITKDAINHVHDRLTDILIAAGYIDE